MNRQRIGDPGRTPSAPELWTCPTCGGTVATPFCPTCGESRLRPRDLTLRGLFDQLVEAFSSLDGRLLRSFRRLVSRPGALTVAYIAGRRKPFAGPVQLFLIANVLFFAVQSLTHTNVFSSPLADHLHHQDWEVVARRLVADHLAASGTTLTLYEPVFDRAVVVNAKSLIILMVVPFALLLPVAFYRDRRPFLTHVVFAFHLYAFLLLLFCVSLGIAALDVGLGGGGLRSSRLDNVLSIVNLTGCAAYLYLSMGTVYGTRGVPRLLKAIALALAVGGIVLGYRFALLLITLYGT
ncbi:MAG TPA: DUF3667 domain-containing protein [Thermoanaerobaculia bacterium]|nr:DUF3667 domain-containing protein [Thermoanaerobaculia bacterium]